FESVAILVNILSLASSFCEVQLQFTPREFIAKLRSDERQVLGIERWLQCAGRKQAIRGNVVASEIQCADGKAGSQHRKTRRFLKAVAGGLERASHQEGIQRSRQREGVHPALVIPEHEIV